MRSLGMLTTVVGGAVALVVLAVGVASIPDIQRYLKIRAM